MTRDAGERERRLSHGSLHRHQVLKEPGHSFMSPEFWLPRDWQSPLNRAPTLAVASLPLVHTDYEALCGVCHLGCSPYLVGLGSLFLVECLVGRIEFLLLAKK